MAAPTDDYGPYARVYNERWGPHLVPAIMPALDRLLLADLPPGAALLDLCCGGGQVTKALADRGYRVAGIDLSAEMLAHARRIAPEIDFTLGDARSFDLPPIHDGVLSTSDSVNHILSLEEVAAVFANVQRALKEGGRFVFDVFLAEDYDPGPMRTHAEVRETWALFVRERWDAEQRMSRGETSLFYLEDGAWRRWDSTSPERFYTAAELTGALEGAGFTDVRLVDRERDLGLTDLGKRTYFVARKAS